MKIIFGNIFTIFFLLTAFQTFAQVSNVKLDNDVYKYLSNLSQKGIIDYDDLVNPLSRRYIAQKLIEARGKYIHLTKLQKEEQKFYEAEYGYEISGEKENRKRRKGEWRSGGDRNENDELRRMSDEEGSLNKETKKKKLRELTDKSWEFEERKPFSKDKEKADSELGRVEKSEWVKGSYGNAFIEFDEFKRWRFFNYQNKNINVNVNPIAGYEIGNWEKSNYQNLLLGLSFNGELGNIVGFNFELKQTRESPRVSSLLYNRFSKETTIDLQLADADRLEYSTVNVDIGFSWDWGTFIVGKNHLNWGYAENGKIVLSERAPSFPYIRLDLKPTDWLTFNYIHAWLNSDVVDSNSFYPTWRVEKWSNTNRYTYISKYLAMHSVTLSPIKGLDISLGESVVYADNLQIAYLIPIMFFDLVDEYLNRNDNYAGASTQLFLSVSSRNHIPNTHLYGSFHADELTPEGLFNPETQYYKFAFTFGASTIDMPIDNLGFTLEYTKVYPGNYRHFIPTLTYESSSSVMGHWMGDNGDLFYGALDYTVFRGLKVKLWTQHIRKGTEAKGNRAYKIQIPQPGFLFTDRIGDRKNYSYYGIDIGYEILHDLWVKCHFQYIDYEQRIADDEFKSSLNRDLAFSFGYGI